MSPYAPFREQIEAWLDEGWTDQMIADRLAFDHEVGTANGKCIAAYRARTGLKSKVRGRPRKFRPAQAERVRQRHQRDGVTYRALRDQLGVSSKTVWKYLRVYDGAPA